MSLAGSVGLRNDGGDPLSPFRQKPRPDLLRVFHHVGVRHDVAARIDDYSGPEDQLTTHHGAGARDTRTWTTLGETRAASASMERLNSLSGLI
jgi:hypothetical protein